MTTTGRNRVALKEPCLVEMRRRMPPGTRERGRVTSSKKLVKHANPIGGENYKATPGDMKRKSPSFQWKAMVG
jgi:hypothetical protein